MWVRSLLASVVFTSAAVAAPVPTRLVLATEQAAEFDRLWDACQENDGDRAHLYLRLIAEPDAATAYLTAKLPPMELGEREAKQLLADLDSEDEKVWKGAYRALVVRDIRLAMTPTAAWVLASSERQRMRFTGLLCGFAGPDELPSRGVLPAQGVLCELEVKKLDLLEAAMTWNKDGREVVRSRFIRVGYAEEMETKWPLPPAIRAGTAVAALERFGTPLAKKHLQALAEGDEAGHATKAAKAALKRMKADPPKLTPPADLWKAEHGGWGWPEVLSQLLAQPKETVAFLKDKLKPLMLTEKQAKALLAKLFSDDEREWKAALEELMTFDLRLAMTAKDAWKLAVTPTADRRLRAALDGQPGAAEDGKFGSERWQRANTLDDPILANRWQREEAAVRVLDAIGTDDALAVVNAMATGHKDAGPTKVAKEVLKRRGIK